MCWSLMEQTTLDYGDAKFYLHWMQVELQEKLIEMDEKVWKKINRMTLELLGLAYH